MAAIRFDGFAGVVSAGCPVANRPCGFTSLTSSFGSSGSRGGTGAASAFGMSSSPQPDCGSKPAGPMSRALRRISSKIWVTSSVGRTVQTHAAAADTIGAEKLVPSSRGE